MLYTACECACYFVMSLLRLFTRIPNNHCVTYTCQEQRPLACTIKRKEEIKSGTSGCGSFVVPYFQPATSTDRLHIYILSCHGMSSVVKK